jgi:hypothetical protein
MRTFQSADEPALYASCAVEVVPVGLPASVEPGPNLLRDLEGVRAYLGGSSYWVPAAKLGDFNDLSCEMVTWARPQSDPENTGAMVLHDVSRATVTIPITDDRCPTLSILSFLKKKQGWIPVDHGVEHKDVAGREFDSRAKVRMKKYYVSLAYLEKCLQFTSCVPSQQPVTFYKCVLAGIAVEPHLGDKHYSKVSNGFLARQGKQLLPLPAPEEALPLGAPDDDDAVMVDGDMDTGPKKKRRASGVAGRARSPQKGGAPKPVPVRDVGEPQPGTPVIVCGGASGSGGGGPGPAAPPVGGVETPNASDDDGVMAVPEPKQDRPTSRACKLRERYADKLQPGLGEALVVYDPYVTPAGKHEPNWIVF